VGAMFESEGNVFPTDFLTNVHLPYDEEIKLSPKITPKLNLYRHPMIDMMKKTVKVKDIMNGIEGMLKTDESFKEVHRRIIDTLFISTKKVLPEDYNYFGNNNYQTILEFFLIHNPIFVSTLTFSKEFFGSGSFELNSYVPNASYGNWYSEVMKSARITDYRVNAKFSDSMKLRSIKVFTSSGSEIKVATEEYDKYCSVLLYSLLYYAHVLHCAIHILHYIMCAAIVYATEDVPVMQVWAEPYLRSVPAKYAEIGLIFMGSTDDSILTGSNGFGANDDPLKSVVTRLLSEWTSYKTAEEFQQKFIFGSLSRSISSTDRVIMKLGILNEFQKHTRLIAPFASELCAEFEADRKTLYLVNDKIRSFLSRTGSAISAVDGLSPWLHLMSITGIVHGCTLSITRLSCIPGVIRWRDVMTQFWDAKDTHFCNVLISTITGVREDYHVFTSTIYNQLLLSNGVREILNKYDRLSTSLKLDYTEKCLENVDFTEYGWIFTDYCTDGYDGKQLTFVSYI
jgi:hypothetical protein